MAAWCPSSKSTPPARTSARGSSCFGRNSNSALRIPREAKRWPMAERCRAMSRWRGKRYLRAPNWPDLDRKQLFWKEFKLCLAHPKGSKTLAYGGTLQGDVAMAGQALFACAELAGFRSEAVVLEGIQTLPCASQGKQNVGLWRNVAGRCRDGGASAICVRRTGRIWQGHPGPCRRRRRDVDSRSGGRPVWRAGQLLARLLPCVRLPQRRRQGHRRRRARSGSLDGRTKGKIENATSGRTSEDIA